MKCILCDQRRGKRYCPAKNTSICTQCCGEKRVVEIQCPPDCSYLATGQSYQLQKKFVAQFNHETDPLRRRKLYETNTRFAGLIDSLEKAIVKFARDVRALNDRDVLEAVSLLRETYRTEQKGIIFEHSSSSPVIQSLFHELRSFLEEHRNEGREQAAPLKIGNILDCLEVLDMNIRFHLESHSGAETYLRFVKRYHPEETARAYEGLILPK